MVRPAPADRAAASESEPDLPAPPRTATVGATPRAAYSPTTRSTSAGAPHTSMTMSARCGSRSAGSVAAMLRPKRMAWPVAGTCSERPSQRSRPSVIARGVSESETSVATRSPDPQPEGAVGADLLDGADEHAPRAGDRVLHLAAGRDDVEHLVAHGAAVDHAVARVLLGELAVGRGVEVERLDGDAHLVVPQLGARVEAPGGLRQRDGVADGFEDAVQADRRRRHAGSGRTIRGGRRRV